MELLPAPHAQRAGNDSMISEGVGGGYEALAVLPWGSMTNFLAAPWSNSA